MAPEQLKCVVSRHDKLTLGFPDDLFHYNGSQSVCWNGIS